MKNCTYVLRAVLCLCVLFFARVLPGYSQQIQTGLTSSTGDYLGFLEYKPTDYDQKTTTKYPLIIFLHGIGERGNGTSDLSRVACCGLPRIIKLGHKMTFTWNGKTETFLVLSPQCPTKYGMWPSVFIEELIQYAKQNLRVDPDRIFLTGLSMGGGGTFRFISDSKPENPKLISAAATICAPCTFRSGQYVADAKLPFWAFHAADDPTASAECTKTAISKVNGVNPEVKPLFDLWPTGGHIVWDRVYTDTNYVYQGIVNIYEWFLGQNRTLPVNKLPKANAGADISITTADATAVLNAGASTDADGKLVRYVWKKISGPSAGSITKPFGTSASTTVTGLTVAGTYQYQLAVVDDRAAFTLDTLTINVSAGTATPNKAPVAKAGNDITITLPVSSVTLNGAASSDEDGSISAYAWSKVSGGTASIAQAANVSSAVNNLAEGTYVFRLKVTDNKGATHEDDITVVVKPAPVVPNKAPVAKAGNDITITLPVSSVTLNGAASSDEDGSISTYAWSKVSGGTASIAQAANVSSAVNNLVEGTYVFRLKVTDNKGATHEDDITVVVKPAPVVPNKAPVAKAGDDITITLPVSSVTLNGAASSDEDGSISTYAWSKVSGGTASIAQAANVSSAVNNLAEGTYVFRLKVTDNKGATHEDDITVVVKPAPVVPNKAPVAKAGDDITITLPVSSVILNGAASSDEDGSISTYAWSKVSGGTASIAQAANVSSAVNNLVEGSYVFRLKVTDNKGATHEDDITVVVKPAPVVPNKAPVAKAGNDITITLPVSSVTLNGAASSDEDGSISTYAWSKVSGGTASIAQAANVSSAVNNLAEGTYVFRLKVTDNKGATHEDDITVIVKPAPNKAPVAKAGDDITITLPVSSVTLNGAASSDEDGSISTYAWSKVSGGTASIAEAANVSSAVNNLVEGTYVFRLKVTDNKGATHEDDITVIVKAAPNKVPVAKAGDDITITLPVSKVNLNGNGSIDEDGTIITYVWSKVSGPNTFQIVTPNTVGSEVRNLVEGTYVFRLLVRDNRGGENTDVVTVKVNPAPPPPNVAPVAQAGQDITTTLPDNNVTLNGTSSQDPDGTIVSYSWSFVSGPAGHNITSPSTVSTTVLDLEEGTYFFRLEVKDNDNATNADTVKVVVRPESTPPPAPNVAPVAKAGNDITITLPVDEVTLNGSASTDEDGSITNYSWTKISGPSQFNISSPASSVTSITNLVEGTYSFQLQVKDNDGALGQATVNVIVKGALNTGPKADAGADIQVRLPVPVLKLNGLEAYDTDGTITNYEWIKMSGPDGITINNATTTTPGVTGLTEGIYIFRLTITDNSGDTDFDDVKVTVLPELKEDSTNNPGNPGNPGDSTESPDDNLKYEEQIKMYPNPALSDVNVEVNSDTTGQARMIFYNVSGAAVKSLNTNIVTKRHRQNVNVGSLRPGVYYVEVVIAGKKRMVTKLIKR